jgi:CheY-like chemotaxis protein
MDSQKDSYLESGMDGFHSKPIRPELLIKDINRVLKAKTTHLG